MKISALLFLISFVLLSEFVMAQWKRETGFSEGITSPVYNNKRYFDETPGVMAKLGFAQSWYAPDKKISLKPEVSLGMDIFLIDYTHGGKAAGGTHEGTIVAINGGLAAMAEIRILPRTSLAVGPSGKFLLTDVTKTVYTYDGGMLYPGISVHKEFKGFNREYLSKPSLGVKAMLIQRNLNEKIRMGMIFDYQWKNSEEDYFYFSRTMEISFYLGLL